MYSIVLSAMDKLPAANIEVRRQNSSRAFLLPLRNSSLEIISTKDAIEYKAINNVEFRVTKVEGPPHFLDL